MLKYVVLIPLSLTFLTLTKAEEINENVNFIQQNDKWSLWSNWSHCSKQQICYSGSKVRRRSCLTSRHSICVGTYEESEDCPSTSCLESANRIYINTAPAGYQSFISQECDVDIKYSFSGTRSAMIVKEVKDICKKLQLKFQLGYFNLKQIAGDDTKELQSMTKYCFEPYNMSLKEAKSLIKFNRKTKSSLYQVPSKNSSEEVAGIVVLFNKVTKELEGIFFATKSKGLGYKRIFYKRWKGQGLEETF